MVSVGLGGLCVGFVLFGGPGDIVVDSEIQKLDGKAVKSSD